ncbi:MAG TPA: polymer-forming cytoskeletal protein [Nitrospirae bacterium]|nr:polymer-forming cytoskeletal [bacterium BMS3Abin06]HDH13359.1 polymer-forming cytoskeletal protein [Nitrospirota bacterium]HDZ00727.1 polymer-forming cytoskeletal protein [Nitrospirota bacterium]
MFKKWASESEMEEVKTDNNGKDIISDINKKTGKEIRHETGGDEKVNTILKGSKLIGNINVSCDLELSGDVEGNITSEGSSNIVIKGTCKGNIKTKEGNVNIEGELNTGNITAGNDVKITGKFNGGEVKAKGRIYINGEFNGKLEGNEIEIGPDASGKGELFYREYIAVSRGAKVEGQICRIQKELTLVKDSPEKKVVDFKTPAGEIKK